MPRFTKIVCCFGLVLLVASLASAQGVMFVKNNRVGIGVSDPVVKLDVRGDADAEVRVNNTTGSVGDRYLLRLTNNGGTRMQLNNTNVGNTWSYFHLNNGGFAITVDGSGQQEFFLDAVGNLTVTGTVTGSSSREVKTNFVELSSADVLDRVLGLPVSEWSYKNDGGTRHFGPMAEDFHAAFGLGKSDKFLAPSDVAGVALAAVHGLNDRLDVKDQRILELEAEVAQLKEMVEAIANQ